MRQFTVSIAAGDVLPTPIAQEVAFAEAGFVAKGDGHIEYDQGSEEHYSKAISEKF